MFYTLAQRKLLSHGTEYETGVKFIDIFNESPR